MKSRRESSIEDEGAGTEFALDALNTIRLWRKLFDLGVPRVWAKRERLFLQGAPARKFSCSREVLQS